MKNDTMIITGGAGFIGSNFVRLALTSTQARLVVVDKLTYAGNLTSLKDVSGDPRFSFVKADIADVAAVQELFAKENPASVVNFAAETHVDRSIDGPKAFIETNIVGAFSLLDAARRLPEDVRKALRFVHVSTDEVYGSLGPTGLFTEETPYSPNSPYSASKAGADHLVHAYFETYGLPAMITNCSNNYGPYQFPEKLIPLTILNAIDAKALPIYGDGKNIRDWIFVEDHCEGILSVLMGGRPGQKYNIGASTEKMNIEIVDTICDALEEFFPAVANPAMKKAGKAAYRDLKTYVKDRPGHDRRYAIDSSKITRERNWKPKNNFTEGLRKTVRWYLDNRAWCETVQSGNYQRERLGLGK